MCRIPMAASQRNAPHPALHTSRQHLQDDAKKGLLGNPCGFWLPSAMQRQPSWDGWQCVTLTRDSCTALHASALPDGFVSRCSLLKCTYITREEKPQRPEAPLGCAGGGSKTRGRNEHLAAAPPRFPPTAGSPREGRRWAATFHAAR